MRSLGAALEKRGAGERSLQNLSKMTRAARLGARRVSRIAAAGADGRPPVLQGHSCADRGGRSVGGFRAC